MGLQIPQRRARLRLAGSPLAVSQQPTVLRRCSRGLSPVGDSCPNGENKMNIFRRIACCRDTALLLLCVTLALSQMAAAQIWVASTGAVDESSTSTYLFTGQAAFVRSSPKTVILRY